MIWKPKEKELTREDAVAQAKEELAPYWFGISPQFAGVPSSGGYDALPLDEKFLKKSWLIFFFDPTEFSGQIACEFANEWYQRYSMHSLEFLFVLIPPYQTWKRRETVQEYREMIQIPFPVAVDSDQSILGAFGSMVTPLILLLSEGKQYFKFSGKHWIKKSELNIQEFLRTRDPGLSLLPVYHSIRTETCDVKRMEFGFAPVLGHEAPFEKPGFLPSAEGFRLGRFHSLRSGRLREGEIFISGEWYQDAERIMTSDPNASLSFVSPGSSVSLIAQSLSKTVENPIITVDIDGVPAYESVAAENLTLDDSGQSVIRVKKVQVYHVLKSMPPEKQQIQFRFTKANLAPVALYGLRFGDTVVSTDRLL
jgi:hypothetical protein